MINLIIVMAGDDDDDNDSWLIKMRMRMMDGWL